MLTQLKLITVGIGTNLNCAWAKKQSLNADTKLITVGIGTNLNCAWAKKQSLNADTTEADHHRDRD